MLSDYQSDPWKMLAYAAAYALGNYLGSWLEERLAFGLSSMQIVVTDKETNDLISEELRQHGFGVTELTAQGRDDATRYMLLSTLRRKLADEAIALVQKIAPNAMITVSDVKSQRSGYLRTAPARKKRKGL